jgi:hypothetical protein
MDTPRLSLLAALVSILSAGGVATVIACSDVGTTTYGDPSGLRSANLPGEGGTEAVICGGDGGAEGGGGGGGGGGGACAVSFKTDIYPNMIAAGAWKCASTGKCHGGGQAPPIDGTSPQTVYDSLKVYSIKVGNNTVPYINADGGKDPSAHSFECNVTGQCGSGMPIAPGTPLTTDQVCRIDAWLRCGAPNN